jgi:hypothetical protein
MHINPLFDFFKYRQVQMIIIGQYWQSVHDFVWFALEKRNDTEIFWMYILRHMTLCNFL